MQYKEFVCVFGLWCFLLVWTSSATECLNVSPTTHSFNWTVYYTRENPDGFYRTLITVTDRKSIDEVNHFPGPKIDVMKGDTIDVYLQNNLPTESTSIHWHGLHQKESPWMDGVQQVTQFPILPTHSFHYSFKADRIGTHWYHSHTGGQYTDGLLGMLIVRDPCDPYKDLPEHHMIINEWYHNDVVDAFDLTKKPNGSAHSGSPSLVSGLVNGKGRFECTSEQINKSMCATNHSLERFVVTKNLTYRFRIVSGGSQFIYTLSIDQHNITIISMDGVYVNNHTVQAINIDIGQRYDILVHMNQPIDRYWIRINATRNRGEIGSDFKAILQYSEASNADPVSKYVKPETILDDSTSLVPNDHNNNNLYIPLKPNNFNISNSLILNISCNIPLLTECYINQIQYHITKTPTLLSLYKKETNNGNIIETDYNENLMIIVNNYTPLTHPLHLHGHDFYIFGTGNDQSSVRNFNLDEDYKKLNFENPPIRDTFKLPKYSWVVLGTITNNPGSWLFHCHITYDMEVGMGRVINVKGHIPMIPNDYPITDDYIKYASSLSSAKHISTFLVLFLLLLISLKSN